MIFEIRDKELLLDMIESSIVYYYDEGLKGEVIFQDVPKDIIERNFKEKIMEKYKSFRIEHCWINAIPKGHSSMEGHRHDKEVWVYYLSTPENCGNLILVDQNKTLTPKENEIVIVPKGELHKVTTNLNDAPRISLAMEIVPGK